MKKGIVTLVICVIVLIAGCSAMEKVNNISNSTSSTPTPAAKETPTPTPGPVETKLSLKEKGTIGDWDVTVKKVAVKKKIANGKYRYFQAKKGMTYVVFDITVKNNGKKAEAFVPFVGLENQIVQSKVLDEKQNEYKPMQLLAYDKDIVSKTIQPASKKSGVLAFEIPKKAGKKKKKLVLSFEKKDEKLVYSMQK